MIKHAVIADIGYFEDIEKNAGHTLNFSHFSCANWIFRSVKIKAAIVEMDERENGVRAILNFGYTIGHGLELASGYRIPHGIAVALGIRCESWISSRIGLLPKTDAERIDSLLDALKFPRTVGKIQPASVLCFVARDKKNR